MGLDEIIYVRYRRDGLRREGGPGLQSIPAFEGQCRGRDRTKVLRLVFINLRTFF